GRVRKIVDIDGAGIGPAATTRFALDKWNNTKLMPIGTENTDVWADLDGSNSLQARYFRGDFVDQILGRIEGSNRYWLLADHLSSVRDVITTGGVESIDYDAWGNILQDDASRGRYGWTGREYDVEADLQFNRARYYDASTGRWISQDPLSFDAGDGNLYRYSRNSITTTSDPSGLLIKSITLDGLDEAIKTMREDPILAKAMFPGFNSQYKHIPAEVKSVDEIALVQPVLFYIKKHDEASSVSQGGFFTTMRIALENQIPDPLDDGWVFISVQARRYNDDRRRVETKETLTALGVRQGKLVGNSDLLLEYNSDRVEALPGVAPLQGGEVTLSLQVGFGILKDAAARRQRQKWNPFNNANPIARRLIDGGVRDDVDWLQPVQGGVSFAFDQKVITRFRFRIKDTNFDILAPQA
ncbi:MAG: RHS repeat-associated core domain-containing protein, partial [Gemmataceae bacterium]|nr:RHS repeat-associated core domain-containing protein [Gemmataceae bacterium]